jgi:hypothetical protein
MTMGSLTDLLSGVAPEGLWVWLVGGRDPSVPRAGPEPSVHVDGLDNKIS